MRMVHHLPGTTFSDITDKGDYDSEATAVLTLAETERWFALAITGPYHGDLHSGISETPMTCWKRSVEEAGDFHHIHNPKTFLVDFLPVVRRRIQRHGFLIDHIIYSSNAIKPWIAERDRGHRFLIRRDPRDLSRVFVLHPEEHHYVEIPYRSMSRPAITLWEHRCAVERIRQQGRQQVDEDHIFKMVTEMRLIAEQAVSAKKSARRSVARRAHLPPLGATRPISPPSLESAASPSIRPFDDIELW